MRVTKRQLSKIIRKEKLKLTEVFAAPTSALKDAVLKLFLEAGKVTTADVFDYMREDGWADDEIDAAIVEADTESRW